jgi:hypothetical protein
MTQPNATERAAAQREVSEPFATPEPPIRTIAELKAWVDACNVHDEKAAQWKAEQLRALVHKPFGVFDI